MLFLVGCSLAAAFILPAKIKAKADALVAKQLVDSSVDSAKRYPNARYPARYPRLGSALGGKALA